jgi:hypothetical protein
LRLHEVLPNEIERERVTTLEFQLTSGAEPHGIGTNDQMMSVHDHNERARVRW